MLFRSTIGLATALALFLVSSCNLGGRAPRRPLEGVQDSGAGMLEHLTVPSIQRSGSIMSVRTPQGLSASLDLRGLLDVDNGFRRVGEDPDEDHTARVMQALIEGLFDAGYYDEAKGLTQDDVDAFASRYRLSKPFRVDFSNRSDRHSEEVLVFEGQFLTTVFSLVEDEDHISLATLISPTTDGADGLAKARPALSRQAAYRAASLLVPGFSTESVKPQDLTRVSIRGLSNGDPLSFFWRWNGSGDRYLVSSHGTVLQIDTPFGVQGLDGRRGRDTSLTRLGRISPDPADFSGLRQ